ncbi:MAG: glycosyltransferase family 4 protein [Candidatus Omnitrophica bacterium]|nr:glycosyltransferase family 4 protein [Candidatus Omnitrophota bacterium]MCB9747055.1 glycosyltransferase family 4 protein [Candidatus Omnitrophota bacterium]
MKIVVIGTRGFPNVQGGVESHCEHLYPNIVLHGGDVTVIGRKPYLSPQVTEYKKVKIVHKECTTNKYLEAISHTFSGVFEAKKLNADILHIHAIGPSIMTLVAKLMGLKVVVTNHGPDYVRSKWNLFAKIILKLGEFFGSKMANEVICISNPIAESIEKKYKRNVNVIPNGVIIEDRVESKEFLKKHHLTDHKYILCVGRLVPEKGFHDLIDAFNRITNGQDQLNSWKLVVVGDADHEGKYSLELKDKAKQNPNVILTGTLKGQALREVFSHAGLFVLPSYHEGLPIVLLEAMSFGLSCIVSDIPANRNVGLSEDRHFKAGDIEALAAKIKKYMSVEFSESESKAQIEMIRQNYDWDHIAEKTVDVYNAVLNRKKREMQLV